MKRVVTSLLLVLSTLPVGCGPGEDRGGGGEVRVAVAGNFMEAHEALAARFEAQTGTRIRTSAGATGQLHAQIVNGAPFDLFLAADAERPRLLEERGLAVSGSRATYATGRLALFGPGLDSVRDAGADLTAAGITYVAVANPRTAPYGVAAEETLRTLGLEEAVRPRLVQGESVLQAVQFVRSGAAELGFVPYASVLREPPRSYWLVPESHHAPIRQDAVLLLSAEDPDAAEAYLRFLLGEEGREVIESFGYGTGFVAGAEGVE